MTRPQNAGSLANLKGKIMNQKTKEMIDNMSYEDMLRERRFGIMADPLFQGLSGMYFSAIMMLKRNEIGSKEHLEISRRIGWKRRT